MNTLRLATDLQPAPGIGAGEQALLRREISLLAATEDRGATLDSLDRVAAAIGMPMMGWSPDVASPYYTAEMDAFLRRQGWPEEIIELWRDRRAGLKVALYTRCRLTNLPFVTSLGESHRRQRRMPASKEERIAEGICRALGFRSLLTVPARLPTGTVSMLNWAGSQPVDVARALLDEVGPELLTITYLAMRNLHRRLYADRLQDDLAIRLTPREWDCMRLTAQGFREADIARLVNVAPTTVRYHIENVVQKLGASNRTHAVALAAQRGLLGAIGQ